MVLLPVQHSAVDSTGRVHVKGLSEWAYGMSRVAEVVADAVVLLQGSTAEVTPRVVSNAYPPTAPVNAPGGVYPLAAGLGPMSQARLNLLGGWRGR
jgi:hypothetical protein